MTPASGEIVSQNGAHRLQKAGVFLSWLRVFSFTTRPKKAPASSPATLGGRNEVDMISIRTILKGKKFENQFPATMRFGIRKAAREIKRVDLIAESGDTSSGKNSARNYKKTKVAG
jgi:hypothetical protein